MRNLGNMSIKLFYTPPKDKCFDELKNLCIRFWEVYEDVNLFNEEADRLMKEYTQSKIDQIKELKNEGANFVSMIQMIHPNTREVIAKHLSLETRNEISMRLHGMEDGWVKGENEFDPFNIWNHNNH